MPVLKEQIGVFNEADCCSRYPTSAWGFRSLLICNFCSNGSLVNLLAIKYTISVRSIIKGIIHPKMKIQSSFTHPEVVPNLYEFLSSHET